MSGSHKRAAIRKQEQLGMAHSTASRKLRDILLYEALKKLGESRCFVCGMEIESVEELTVEHKTPWENIDPALFWNLDNIAFSHRKCNKPHSLKLKPRERFKTPNGTAWCSRCKRNKDTESFYKSSKRWSGLQAYCKECILNYRSMETFST